MRRSGYQERIRRKDLLPQAPRNRIAICKRWVVDIDDSTRYQDPIVFPTREITSVTAMASAPARPSPPSHVLETCLYVRDMNQSLAFYINVLGLQPQIKSSRLTMFPLGNTTLILFQLGMTASDSVSESGIVPGHGPDEQTLIALTEENDKPDSDSRRLHMHYCLAVSSREEVEVWEEYLKSMEVKLRGSMNWQKGGKSVYFEDPDGHIGEIGSRGIWEHW